MQQCTFFTCSYGSSINLLGMCVLLQFALEHLHLILIKSKIQFQVVVVTKNVEDRDCEFGI